MATFRVQKNQNYTVMSNHHLRNKEITLKAKGLLSQMLSLPEDWDYTLKGLSQINRESVGAISTAVLELETAGYIIRRQGRDTKGKMTAIEYIIFEQPQQPESDYPLSENPIPDNPMTGKPLSENPAQLNTYVLNTNKQNTNKQNTDPSITHSFPFRAEAETPQNAAPQRKGKEGNDSERYRKIIEGNINLPLLLSEKPDDAARLYELLLLMVEAVCSKRKLFRISSDDIPQAQVKERFLQLNEEHIRFVLECLDANTSQIRSMKQYLLATLYNAPTTMTNQYNAQVNHDLYGSSD